ncbi:hypothetical protein ACX1N5_13960 [Acinetobacter sp. ANC 4636]
MNSARELKNHNAATAFDQAKTSVLNALSGDPFGLTMSQLMTVCRLSNKTLKQVLPALNLELDDGVYKLPLSAKKSTDQKAQQPLPDPEIKVLKKSNTENIKQPMKLGGRLSSAEIKALKKKEDRIHAVIKQYDGLSLDFMTDLVGDSIENIIASACIIKKHSENLEDAKAAGDFIDSLGNTHKDIIQKFFDPEHPEYKPRENEYSPVKNEYKAPKSEYLPVKNEDISSNAQPKRVAIPSLESCKSLIQTTTVKTHNLFLDKDQITSLLKDAFGLDDVIWRTQGSKVLGVHMSRTENVEG